MVSIRRFIAVMVMLGLCAVGIGVDHAVNAMCFDVLSGQNFPASAHYYAPSANGCTPPHSGWTGYAPLKRRH